MSDKKTLKRINFKATRVAIIDKMNRAPSFAYHISDRRKFNELLNTTDAEEMRELAEFIGVAVVMEDIAEKG